MLASECLYLHSTGPDVIANLLWISFPSQDLELEVSYTPKPTSNCSISNGNNNF